MLPTLETILRFPVQEQKGFAGEKTLALEVPGDTEGGMLRITNRGKTAIVDVDLSGNSALVAQVSKA